MRRIPDILISLLLVFCISCRFLRPLADIYATRLYPSISRSLTWMASVTSHSLTEVVANLSLLALILTPFLLKARRRGSWRQVLFCELRFLAILYIWFYMGWGNNYFRSSIYQRLETRPAVFKKDAFLGFLERYTIELKESHIYMSDLNRETVETSIRNGYTNLTPKSGLTTPLSYQHPKNLLLNRICSGSGVSGFIGPFFDELHIMDEVLDMEYPFTLAHEYAHVLGVSEEAEANFWAFRLCSESPDPQIRYSGYLGILPYVWNSAQQLLDAEEFEEWKRSLSKEVISDLSKKQEHWRSLRLKALDEAQSRLYNFFLKGNSIKEGTRNYAGVVRMVISHEHMEVF